MLMERLGDSLRTYLHNMRLLTFDSVTALKIGIQVCNLLEILHSIGYVHGDLKLENLVLGRD